MPTKRELKLIAFSAVFLLFIAGCGGGKTPAGAPTTPFLGGTSGLEISFLEGSPPAEVTDGDTFDFQAVVKLRNQGESDLKKEDVEVSLIGFLPSDFRSGKVCRGDGTTVCTTDAGCSSVASTCGIDLKCTGDGTTPCTVGGTECGAATKKCKDDFADADLINRNPDDDPISRKKDSEGNIIESVETFKTFPKEDKNFKFKNALDGNTIFVFRTDVCYRYHTDALSEICVLENMVDIPEDALCDPSETKSVFSSGSPVKVAAFRQNVAGKNKLQFSFDIEHIGQGKVFEISAASKAAVAAAEKALADAKNAVPAVAATVVVAAEKALADAKKAAVDCPKAATDRRTKEDKVIATVKTGLPIVTPGTPSLRCTGLIDDTTESKSSGPVKLVNGKRTITCTQELAAGRTDFKKSADIAIDFNYLGSADKEVLVKHLVSDS